MLTKSTVKFIKSLQEKKYRKQEQSFVVEGAKSVKEVLESDYEVLMLVATPEYIRESSASSKGVEVLETTREMLASLGDFQTNDTVLAVVRMRGQQDLVIPEREYTLLLDDIRDPGNMGTIIRTADWYGIRNIIASKESVDFYNPKVINSTKGSFTRISVHYESLPSVLIPVRLPVYGAMLQGENVHSVKFKEGGIILIGNEASGLSSEVQRFITNPITIPKFGKAESLNAAIATAIILDNIKR
jgi:RNA methyltransferase, TrmH family